MQDRITIPPRRPTGAGTTHVEIYVPEQVLIVFKDDVPELIAHISTGVQNPDGTPKKWCDTLDLRHRAERRAADRAGHEGRNAPTPRRRVASSGSPAATTASAPARWAG